MFKQFLIENYFVKKRRVLQQENSKYGHNLLHGGTFKSFGHKNNNVFKNNVFNKSNRET